MNLKLASDPKLHEGFCRKCTCIHAKSRLATQDFDKKYPNISAWIGVIASFSRALTEGLSAKQTESQFNGALDAAIQSIFDASNK